MDYQSLQLYRDLIVPLLTLTFTTNRPELGTSPRYHRTDVLVPDLRIPDPHDQKTIDTQSVATGPTSPPVPVPQDPTFQTIHSGTESVYPRDRTPPGPHGSKYRDTLVTEDLVEKPESTCVSSRHGPRTQENGGRDPTAGPRSLIIT